MLDVGDNLERAYSAVPVEALEGKDKDGKKLTADAAVSLLLSLTNGVKLTEKIFDGVSSLNLFISQRSSIHSDNPYKACAA